MENLEIRLYFSEHAYSDSDINRFAALDLQMTFRSSTNRERTVNISSREIAPPLPAISYALDVEEFLQISGAAAVPWRLTGALMFFR